MEHSCPSCGHSFELVISKSMEIRCTECGESFVIAPPEQEAPTLPRKIRGVYLPKLLQASAVILFLGLSGILLHIPFSGLVLWLGALFVFLQLTLGRRTMCDRCRTPVDKHAKLCAYCELPFEGEEGPLITAPKPD